MSALRRTSLLAFAVAVGVAAFAVGRHLFAPRFPGLEPRPPSWPATFQELCAQEPVARAPGAPPWSWPSAQDFEAARAEVTRSGPLPLYLGTLRSPSDATWTPLRAAFSLARTRGPGATKAVLRIEAFDIGPGDARADRLRDHVIGATSALEVTEPSELAEVGFPAPWTSGPAIWIADDLQPAPAPAFSEEAAALRAYVDALLADHPGDPEIPFGRCSHDGRPQTVANDELERAVVEGATGRFLRLAIQVSRGLPRVAWMSGARLPAIRPSQFDETPVRLAAFYAGLCIAKAGDDYNRPLIPDDPLGAWIVDDGVADQLAPWLRRMAEDESLDAFNRLRMARILASVLGHGKDEYPISIRSTWTREKGPVLERLAVLRLSTAARWWFGGDDDS
jgi:hypothetical protein